MATLNADSVREVVSHLADRKPLRKGASRDDRIRQLLAKGSDGGMDGGRSMQAPAFLLQELRMHMDSGQKQRFDALMLQLIERSELDCWVQMHEVEMKGMSLRDAVMVFLLSLSRLRMTARTSCSQERNETVTEPVLLNMSGTCLRFLRASTGVEEESESWLNNLPQLDRMPVMEVLERFSFAKDDVKPVVHERPLRLWDFITAKGQLSFASLDTSGHEEDESWNERKIEVAEFEKVPTSNALLGGLPEMANGSCTVTLKASSTSRPVNQMRDVRRKTVAPTNKESFERELIPTILLALDGILPAVQSLETASTLRRATALFKLLSKVIRAGKHRFALDRFLAVSGSDDDVQSTFVSCVASIMRLHSASLQNLVISIQKRCQTDSGNDSAVAEEASVSLVEVVLHTESIQKQVAALASLCGLRDFKIGTDAEAAKEKLPSGMQLLSNLFTDLLEADNQMGPMIRYLFCCCFRRFLGSMRAWLYTDEDVFSTNSGDVASPVPLPEFLQSVQKSFWEAGLQLRILSKFHTQLRTEEAIVHAIRDVSDMESLQMTKVCEELGDKLALSAPGFCEIGLTHWLTVSDRNAVPLPFQHNALHEVVKIVNRCASDRLDEVNRVLKTAREIRRIEKDIETAELLASFQERVAAIEEEKRAALQRASERSRRMRSVLLEQKEAIDEKTTRLTTVRLREIHDEQVALKDGVMKEHNEALLRLEKEMMATGYGVTNDIDAAQMEVDDTAHDEVVVAGEDDDDAKMAIDGEFEAPEQSHADTISAHELEEDHLNTCLTKRERHERVDCMEIPAEEEASILRHNTVVESNRRTGDQTHESSKPGPAALTVPEDADDSMVPVSAMIEGCVIQPAVLQHRCISHAFAEIFCEELGFIEVVSYLKKFYFSESADWMAILTKNVFHEVSGGDALSSRMLSSLLDDSILESAYQHLPPSSHVTLSLGLEESSGGDEFFDVSSLQLINRLCLRAKVQWPMSLVVTDNCLEQYNAVFRALMKIRQARWWIDQVWWKFNEVKRFNLPDRATAGRLKLLRLWYQDVINIVAMLQSHMHHELNQSQWELFQKKMKQPGLSFTKIQGIHANYVEGALETCFQKATTRRLKSMMESSLQSVVNFCSVLHKKPRQLERHQPLLVSLIKEEGMWEELEKLSSELKNRSGAFYKTLKYRAKRGECTDGLFVLMSFNSYYGSSAQE